MTRTERSQYPAALLKDRHSRTGLSKTEQGHKHGAGVHNWGSFTEEGNLEWQGANDAAAEEAMFPDDDDVADARAAAAATDEADPGMPDKHRRADAAEDKGDGASDAGSSPGANQAAANARPAPGRRMSSITPEEWEQAKLFRERGIRKDSKDLDLAHIARTSYGVSMSPPGAGAFATSPSKIKNGFAL